MTAEIVWESSTLCRTLWWGMVFAAEYDTIRIFRRIVKHNMLVIMVLEDMAYWIYVSIKIFSICFYVNDGVIRAFIIAGFIMGAGLYVKALSRYYIKYGVKLISFFIKIGAVYMKFETRRERELRRKRQKRSAILGMVFAILVVIGLGILLWNGKKNIEAKNVEYEKEISQLQAQVDSEQKRTDELNEYKKYIQTKKFVEEVAKDKFGLVYPDEIIFRGKK
uniref:spore cortex biosynthesis protein YabQ n=2 Tax=Lachnospira sp. TaxID=2049031 RepID=UPI003FEE8FC4